MVLQQQALIRHDNGGARGTGTVGSVGRNLQMQFADFVAQVDRLEFNVRQQIEMLETLKNHLCRNISGDAR